ncbi:hypothetical protein N8J89_07845 [Crossiella sp. CA-258035]|uniref:hypothetical protein n=1 Tax=Crossiella sp. CA-258035 TaxID=2981138 RepID=UPI0024BD5619|nr:hypothetical protein [Crossiella sp. CA-258035]WHT20966.1 hypothetical protein N8J89_07845 [Crossiella sp. CA-258035]
MTAETPATPDLRLSPDGKRLATKTFPTSPWCWMWRTVAGPLYFGAATNDEVADWTPLVPAPATVDREFLLCLHRQAQDNQRAVAAQNREDAFQFWSGCPGGSIA